MIRMLKEVLYRFSQIKYKAEERAENESSTAASRFILPQTYNQINFKS